MDLRLPLDGLDDYKSASQRARIGTESWGSKNLFCANCDSPRLTALPHNTAAFDFRCPQCTAPFQLKSQSKPFGSKILDAAYSEMRRAILEDRTPNLLVLHYSLETWSIRNLLIVPRFAFSLAAVEKRKPLALTAPDGSAATSCSTKFQSTLAFQWFATDTSFRQNPSAMVISEYAPSPNSPPKDAAGLSTC